MNSNKHKQETLTTKDLNYLGHILQVIEKEKIQFFNLNKLSPAWLLSEKQLRDALFWDRYNRTRIIGWRIAILLGIIGAPFTVWVILIALFVTESPIVSFTIPILLTLLILIGFARLSGFLLAFFKGKKVQFESESLTQSEHDAIFHTLQAGKSLPAIPDKWLVKMEKLGALKKGNNGWEFGNKTFSDWLIESKKTKL